MIIAVWPTSNIPWTRAQSQQNFACTHTENNEFKFSQQIITPLRFIRFSCIQLEQTSFQRFLPFVFVCCLINETKIRLVCWHLFTCETPCVLMQSFLGFSLQLCLWVFILCCGNLGIKFFRKPFAFLLKFAGSVCHFKCYLWAKPVQGWTQFVHLCTVGHEKCHKLKAYLFHEHLGYTHIFNQLQCAKWPGKVTGHPNFHKSLFIKPYQTTLNPCTTFQVSNSENNTSPHTICIASLSLVPKSDVHPRWWPSQKRITVTQRMKFAPCFGSFQCFGQLENHRILRKATAPFCSCLLNTGV